MFQQYMGLKAFRIDALQALKLNQASQVQRWQQMEDLFLKAAPAAVAVAIGLHVPLWFCVACPIALGMLAPFLFNAGTFFHHASRHSYSQNNDKVPKTLEG